MSTRFKQRGVAAVAIPWILAGVTAASAGFAAYQSINAGKAASNQALFQARIEGDSAKQQEIQRRQNLIRALSSQNAAAGAGGVETSGSVAAGMRRQISQNSNDLLTINANSSARQSALESQASNSRAAGTAAGVSSLLDGASKTYKAAP